MKQILSITKKAGAKEISPIENSSIRNCEVHELYVSPTGNYSSDGSLSTKWLKMIKMSNPSASFNHLSENEKENIWVSTLIEVSNVKDKQVKILRNIFIFLLKFLLDNLPKRLHSLFRSMKKITCCIYVITAFLLLFGCISQKVQIKTAFKMDDPSVLTFKDCILNGVKIAHNSSHTFYRVADSDTCNAESETRTCNNGSLTGSFLYSSCLPFGFCPSGSGDGPLGGTTRPAMLTVPDSYNSNLNYPLVIMLHGRSQNPDIIEEYLQMRKRADEYNMFVIAPPGTFDNPNDGKDPLRFWNATDGCCNLYGSTVDDVGYLRSLICHIRANYSIDKNLVYIIGLSNGGFMANRMACDAAGYVTGIISIAGAGYADSTKCVPKRPVSVLNINGTEDPLIWFNGMVNGKPGPVPSARQTFNDWAVRNNCHFSDGKNIVKEKKIDFTSEVSGHETDVISRPRSKNCKVQVESWVVQGGDHVMKIQETSYDLLLQWFFSLPTDR